MQVIVCVDDGMGILFNHRRQSRDRVLIQRILEITKGKQIFMNTYSAELFEGNENICIDDDFLKNAGDDDICFVENETLSKYIENPGRKFRKQVKEWRPFWNSRQKCLKRPLILQMTRV